MRNNIKISGERF